MPLNRIIRPVSLALLLFTLLSTELQGFQRPLRLSELYLQLIDSNEEYLEISNRRLIDDINASSEIDAYDFIEDLSERLGRDIQTDSIWVDTQVKTLRLFNVTGSSVGFVS